MKVERSLRSRENRSADSTQHGRGRTPGIQSLGNDLLSIVACALSLSCNVKPNNLSSITSNSILLEAFQERSYIPPANCPLGIRHPLDRWSRARLANWPTTAAPHQQHFILVIQRQGLCLPDHTSEFLHFSLPLWKMG